MGSLPSGPSASKRARREQGSAEDSAGSTVEFFLATEAPLETLSSLDPDVDWLELQTGERAWILQTFLRLRAAGAKVALTDRPRGRLVVFHAKQWRQLERARPDPSALLVGVRGDVSPAPNADLEVVQNPVSVRSRRHVFVPHWPQPALQPRDPGRGTTLRRAAYKGIRESLHPSLRDPSWAERLGELGVVWDADETDYGAPTARRAALRWPDYRETDAVVALRPPRRDLHPGKPATKLYNAWLAGVPAVLGPERAYRAERRSELDYLEAADPHQALACVRRLASEPGLYQAMVDRGASRAAAVAPGAIVEHWTHLLSTILPAAVTLASARRWPRPLRLLAGRIRRSLVRR